MVPVLRDVLNVKKLHLNVKGQKGCNAFLAMCFTLEMTDRISRLKFEIMPQLRAKLH